MSSGITAVLLPACARRVQRPSPQRRHFIQQATTAPALAGVVATGVVPPIKPADREEIVKSHLAISKGSKEIPTALCYEHRMEVMIPPVACANAAAQIGLLRDIYCYGAGEPIVGCAGNGGCPSLIQYLFATGKPSFSWSDVSWHKNIGLKTNEMTMGFPFDVLVQICQRPSRGCPCPPALWRNGRRWMLAGIIYWMLIIFIDQYFLKLYYSILN